MLGVGTLQSRRGHVDLGDTQRLEEPRHDRVVDRVAADPLADRCSRLLLEMIAEILRAAFVLHAHLVSALAAVDDAVQQRLAFARYAAGLVASVLGVVVAQHRLNPFERVPRNVLRVLVLHAVPPLLRRQLCLLHFAGVFGLFPARSPVGRGPRVSRIVEERTDARGRHTLPLDVAVTIATRQQQVVLDEPTDRLCNRLLFEKRGEDQVDAIPHFGAGMLRDHAVGSYQSGRQRESEFTSLRLAQDTGRQPSTNRMQFQLRDLSFQSQQQSSVDRRRIVNAVAVGDQAIVMTAEVEQLIPVRTVSCQPRGVEGEQDADVTECDLRDEMLKAFALVDRRAAASKIGVDDVRVLFMPTERGGSLTQRVLHALALLVGDDLVGARLPDIDHRLAVEVSRLDQFGSVHRSSPS